ncbi:MAG TPA: GGDEF domain-containing protein [Candidatus Dormibacteraeota bacterium]|nr:GGDEF domain-containing protein [Candidatus Dormibacteraeota bacterium]
MTARTWSVRLLVLAFMAVPLPLPTPSVPSVSPPALPVATPKLPVAVSPGASPVVSAAPIGATPTAAATQAGAPGTSSGGSSQGGHAGISIPFTAIYVDSPLDIALLAALAALPLLFGIWLLLFARTLTEARRRRDAQVRLMLAADLGLRPREVTAMSTRALFDLREKSAFDELTGVLRRAAGVSLAEREIARARRHGAALTVAFIDVDGLEDANVSGGRAAGDAVLRGTTEALRAGLRTEDVVLRYGGDEFVCVLTDTDVRDARAKLSAIQDETAVRGIRFCWGLAQLERSDDVVSLLARADRDLYEFKAGRGEIVQLPPRSPETDGEEPKPYLVG